MLIVDVQFSKDGQMLAAGSQDGNVYLWKYENREFTNYSTISINNGFPISIEFSEDNTKILVTTNYRKVLVLNIIELKMYYQAD